MAQQTSALTHLRLDAGSMAVTHSDTSKLSLSHSISITYLPWLTWISRAPCTTRPWGRLTTPRFALFSRRWLGQNRIAFCSGASPHKGWKWKWNGTSITNTLPLQYLTEGGNMLDLCQRCQRIYMCKPLKFWYALNKYSGLSFHLTAYTGTSVVTCFFWMLALKVWPG